MKNWKSSRRRTFPMLHFARLACVGLLLLATSKSLNAAERMIVLTPCARDVGVAGAECGTLEVYENRDTSEGRRIGLKVVVLPALSNDPKPDPLFMLDGGPGMPATRMADGVKAALWRIREQREIVLVDQRGTGESNGLHCSGVDSIEIVGNEYPYEVVRECMENFDADLSLYTTPIAMDDLDDVREALGYEQINLWGGSYGTRASLVYLRRHSDRVRSVILDGVAPTGMRLPLHMGEDAFRSIQLVFDNCEADADCNASYPNLREKYQTLLSRLESAPESIRVPHPRSGLMTDYTIRRNDAVEQLRTALYSADATRLLPLIIQHAHDGDYAPLLAQSEHGSEAIAKLAAGMLFSVLCTEDVRYIDESDLDWIAADSSRRTSIVEIWTKVCESWPKGVLPAGYHDPVVSDKPVLVLSGELDPVTPPRWGAMAAEHLSNSLHVVVPGAAHGTMGYGCVHRLMADFLDRGSVSDLDPSCVEELGRPMFFRSSTGPRVGVSREVGSD